MVTLLCTHRRRQLQHPRARLRLRLCVVSRAVEEEDGVGRLPACHPPLVIQIRRAPAHHGHPREWINSTWRKQRQLKSALSGPSREPRSPNVELIGCQSVRQWLSFFGLRTVDRA
jgi:hypothetical protein